MMKHTLNAKVLGLSIANLLSLAALLGALVDATSAGAEGPASRDLILDLDDHASVGLASLESSVSGNAFNFSGPPPAALPRRPASRFPATATGAPTTA